jgi:hypothetical protein
MMMSTNYKGSSGGGSGSGYNSGGQYKKYPPKTDYQGGQGNKGAYNGGSGSSGYQSQGADSRLMFNNKRIYLRGYNITKDKVMLAIQPKPAQFGETANSYQVNKNGYIQIDFSPIEDGSNQILSTSKRTFILLMKNVGDILDLDTRLAYDSSVDEDGTYI